VRERKKKSNLHHIGQSFRGNQFGQCLAPSNINRPGPVLTRGQQWLVETCLNQFWQFKATSLVQGRWRFPEDPVAAEEKNVVLSLNVSLCTASTGRLQTGKLGLFSFVMLCERLCGLNWWNRRPMVEPYEGLCPEVCSVMVYY